MSLQEIATKLTRLDGELTRALGEIESSLTPGHRPNPGDAHRDWIVVDQFQAGDRQSGAEMIRRYEGLLFRLARRYTTMELEDALQEARIGFLLGLTRARRGHGSSPGSYALLWARAQLGIGAEVQRTVRVPRNAMRDLRARRARGLEPENLLWQGQSLDTPVSDDSSTTHLDALVDPTTSHEYVTEMREEALLARDSSEWVAILERLPPRQARVIRRRFGIGTDGPETLGQIGTSMGISRERVRQLEQQALATLRGIR